MIKPKQKKTKITNKAVVIAYLDRELPGWRKGIKLSERDKKAVKAAKADWGSKRTKKILTRPIAANGEGATLPTGHRLVRIQGEIIIIGSKMKVAA
jgi:hypothetical protein